MDGKNDDPFYDDYADDVALPSAVTDAMAALALAITRSGGSVLAAARAAEDLARAATSGRCLQNPVIYNIAALDLDEAAGTAPSAPETSDGFVEPEPEEEDSHGDDEPDLPEPVNELQLALRRARHLHARDGLPDPRVSEHDAQTGSVSVGRDGAKRIALEEPLASPSMSLLGCLPLCPDDMFPETETLWPTDHEGAGAAGHLLPAANDALDGEHRDGIGAGVDPRCSDASGYLQPEPLHDADVAPHDLGGCICNAIEASRFSNGGGPLAATPTPEAAAQQTISAIGASRFSNGGGPLSATPKPEAAAQQTSSAIGA